MSEQDPKYFKSISGWREWLIENGPVGNPIWVVIQKKASDKDGIGYEEAVMEAIAFGWIDGKMKSLNDDEFMQRFSKRRKNSVWSLKNRKRAERLMSQGRMTPAGLEAVNQAKRNGSWESAVSSKRPAVPIPDDLLAALKDNNAAEKNFKSFPPSARFMYIHWVNEAKRPDTRERRIYTVVKRSEDNLKPGIDLRIIRS